MMNESAQPHVFWSSVSPLASLAGGGLLIMASARLAHAVIVAGALLWVYCFSALAIYPAMRIFPRRGGYLLRIFLASFIGSLYLFLFWFASPLAALETFFLVSLIPLLCAASGIFKRIESLSPARAVSRAASEALVLGFLIIAFAFIREPIGFCSLSLPGGSQGIVLLFSFEGEAFLPIRLVAASSGALLLLGYGMGLYRYFRGMYAPREEDR
jgi:hypothetical protein